MRFAFFPYLSIRRKISLSLSLVRYCFLSVRKKEKRSKEKREKGRKERIASKHLASARKSNFLRVLPPPALILPLLTRSTILTPIFFLLFFFSLSFSFQVCSSIEAAIVSRSLESRRLVRFAVCDAWKTIPKSKFSKVYSREKRWQTLESGSNAFRKKLGGYLRLEMFLDGSIRAVIESLKDTIRFDRVRNLADMRMNTEW